MWEHRTISDAHLQEHRRVQPMESYVDLTQKITRTMEVAEGHVFDHERDDEQREGGRRRQLRRRRRRRRGGRRETPAPEVRHHSGASSRRASDEIARTSRLSRDRADPGLAPPPPRWPCGIASATAMSS